MPRILQKRDAPVVIDIGGRREYIDYKAWVCTNPSCGYHMRIDNGELSIGEELKKSFK